LTIAVILACLAGVLIGVSRQVNGRLSLKEGALGASLWNHGVGFAALTLLAALDVGIAGLDTVKSIFAGAAEAPWQVYLAGPLGVAFVAGGSIAVRRIGAVRAAALIIAGQMAAGVALDLWRGSSAASAVTAIGLVLLLAGVVVGAARR